MAAMAQCKSLPHLPAVSCSQTRHTSSGAPATSKCRQRRLLEQLASTSASVACRASNLQQPAGRGGVWVLPAARPQASQCQPPPPSPGHLLHRNLACNRLQSTATEWRASQSVLLVQQTSG